MIRFFVGKNNEYDNLKAIFFKLVNDVGHLIPYRRDYVLSS